MTLKSTLLTALLVLYASLTFAQTQRSITDPMPSRQVHLDFHTSEFIPGIGEKFNKKQFQEALKVGHVNHINVFAKDHHSWSYYPTKIGKTHPNLNFDLLGEQIKACHEIGVKSPIYFTIGWSARDAEEHPEWLVRKKDGSVSAYHVDENAKPTDKRPFGSWKNLSPVPNSPYHQKIKQQVEEICKNYEVDGFWFDIYHISPTDYSKYSMERMKAEGIDINDVKAVEKSYALALKQHMKELREVVAKYHPKATVFFNSATHPQDKSIFKERLYDMNTNQDLEDLPSTWGGYDKLPVEAKYHLGQNTPATAMSGKFHKAWGEFGGFKHPDAMKYEAAAMISNGVSCNFGDQMHPSGEMDMETYKRIGHAYEYVEKIEEYGLGGVPVSKLGLWLTLNNAADNGVAHILLETHDDFIIANENNLDKLSVVIIPSGASLTEGQAKLINDWTAKGGKLMVFGTGALNKSGKFALNIGADYLRKADFDFDYTVIESSVQKNMVSTPFLNYDPGLLIKPTTAQVLAYIREPYFNRTYAQYASHRETPYKLTNSVYPAVTQDGNVIYFAHNLDQLYYTHGVNLHRQLVKNALDLLNTAPMVEVNNLPSSGRVSFLKQDTKNRYVAHLLYTPALQRGTVTVIEDFLPVPNIQLKITVPEKVKNVYQIPDGKKVSFKRDGESLIISVQEFTMHTGIVIEY